MQQKRNPARDVPHYLRVFQSYLGWRIYIVFGLTVLATLAEGFGIVMVLPLLQSLDTGTSSGAVNGSGQAFQDVVIGLGLAGSTTTILILIAFAFLAKGAVLFGALGVNAYLRAQLLRELKMRLFDDYSHMRYAYYTRRDTGYFTNVINAQITMTLNAFRQLVQLGSQLVATLLFAVMALVVAWRFGLMALLMGAGILLLFRRVNIYVREISRATALENGRLARLLIQFLQGFKYLSATGQSGPLRKQVDRSVTLLTGYELRKGIAETLTTAVREPVVVVLIVAVLLVQLVLLEQPLAPIMVSILLFYRGLGSTMQVQSAWQATLTSIGSLELLRDEFSMQRRQREPDGEVPIPPLATGISLAHVHFRYNPALDEVLHDVSFEIPARTSVAFVGESGAGKSTIADLITLMLKPQHGQVLIDGVPGERVLLASWRRQIGYVSQETVIFNDSIANNISMWGGDSDTDALLMARIRTAAGQARIDGFVDGLPDGYRTIVGDRGVRLSGGQRQRLFIARELFRQPKLLILDEATSALDSDSERAIQQSVDALKGKITVIIIAHRLSTIRNVDHVYVFDQGRLLEHGPYQQLRDAADSRFGQLIAMQAL